MQQQHVIENYNLAQLKIENKIWCNNSNMQVQTRVLELGALIFENYMLREVKSKRMLSCNNNNTKVQTTVYWEIWKLQFNRTKNTKKLWCDNSYIQV